MKMTRVALAGGMMLLASAAVAQETTPIVFGAYYRCNQGLANRADEIIREVFGPIVQKQIDAGNLTSWVWLSHVQGGAWRRLAATIGTDRSAMMEARAAIFDEFINENADAFTELGRICPGHDDYIWTGIANSPIVTDAATAPASLSTYYACDVSREGRTNEIFQDVLAPLYQKHMDLGHIASWGFYAHRSGGRFRRLETFSGQDHNTLMNMQEAILEEAMSTNPIAMQEFREICNWHVDYMWRNATTEQ